MEPTGGGERARAHHVSPNVRRLWEQDRPGSGPPRVGLTLDRIVAVAVELADRDGLEALSMSRLAQVLGFTTAALYRHVSSKNELLLYMQNSAWHPPQTVRSMDQHWRPALEHWCRQMRAVLHRHPWLKRLRFDDQFGTPSQLAWLDLGLSALADTPLSEYQKGQILLLLNGHTFADAVSFSDLQHTHRPEPLQLSLYRGLIETFTSTNRFPALHRAVTGGMLDGPDGRPERNIVDAAFTFGLERILDGVQTLITSLGGGN